jgi:hypothetical protein
MIPITVSPAATYATKGNILFSGTAAQATAAESFADATIEDRLPSGVTISGLRVRTA